jgi:stage V sporulation protein AA
MAFNNDVQVHEVFVQIFKLVTGHENDGFSVLEGGYCIGLGAGILIFYNHFGKKKLSKDPTPLEIEMRLYENDINNTLIDGVKRKNEHIDVG